MPPDELLDRHHEASGRYSAAVAQLAPVLEEIAIATVRDSLPTATQVNVVGEMNEDWAWTLRIQRVLDGNGEVLFDAAAGSDSELEDHLHEVGADYLDLLLGITGEAYLGTHQLGR